VCGGTQSRAMLIKKSSSKSLHSRNRDLAGRAQHLLTGCYGGWFSTAVGGQMASKPQGLCSVPWDGGTLLGPSMPHCPFSTAHPCSPQPPTHAGCPVHRQMPQGGFFHLLLLTMHLGQIPRDHGAEGQVPDVLAGLGLSPLSCNSQMECIENSTCCTLGNFLGQSGLCPLSS
jgi:hypothetical protein